MNKLWNFLESHMGKLISVPIALNTMQLVITILHTLNDGTLPHEDLERFLKAGDGVSLIVLGVIMAFLKARKK